MSEVRLFADIRQLTGTGGVYHAYVYEGTKVVAACRHRHVRRKRPWQPGDTPGLPVYASGSVFARRCAEKMLRRVKRTRALEASGE